MKSKTKDCPGCHKKIGQKTKTCKCGHKFEFKKKIINGKKCPQCTYELKKRAKECDKCKYKYPQKSKKWEIIKDWQKLNKGDTIYLRKGSRGPYFQGEKERIIMAYRGIYTVSKIEKEGIFAYSSDEGFGYIYMGPDKFCETTSLYKRKYILFKKV